MVFECKACDYSTDNKSRYKKHLETKKHLNNSKKKVKKDEDSDAEDVDDVPTYTVPPYVDISTNRCKYCNTSLNAEHELERKEAVIKELRAFITFLEKNIGDHVDTTIATTRATDNAMTVVNFLLAKTDGLLQPVTHKTLEELTYNKNKDLSPEHE